MKETIIRLPLEQYSYIEFPFEGTPEEAIQEYRRVSEYYKNPSTSLKMGLDKVSMLRLVHKYMVSNSLEMEDVDCLGTNIIYSQRDVVNLIKNVFAKISRDSAPPRSPRVAGGEL